MKNLLCIMLSLCIFAVPAMANELLQAGPMLGHVDVAEVVVWVQTKEPAKVSLRYKSSDGAAKETRVIQTNEEELLIARFTVPDLVENTAYTYEVLINDKVQTFDYPLEFKTQPHWWYRTDPPEITFAIGSCLYINDAPYDRPGKPYGGDFETLDVLYEKNPQFMLWMGDNVYLRESDFFTENRINYRYKHVRAYPKLQRVLARMAHYAIWDDHDYGPNDSDRSYSMKDVALNTFKAYWANPHYGMPGNPGVHCHLNWGDLDFFMLDDRYYRAPNRLKDENKDFLGAQQLQWLKDALVASRASFKFIVVGNQALNQFSQHESWTHFPKEYNDLMSYLMMQRIEGVVFLSGDRHHTELLKLERPHGYPLYEFTNSPISAGAGGPRGIEADNPLRVDGTAVAGKRNFGLLNVTGKRNERVLKLQTWDSTGTLQWEYTINQSDLKFKGRR